MECAHIGEDESPCGEEATPYRSIPLCTEHIEKLRWQFQSYSRTAALQSAKYHALESFPGFCYIVLLPDGLIKIGYSNTEDLLKDRYKALSREYGAPVIPLASIRGGFVAEAVLHNQFKEFRVPGNGERFTYSSEMAEYIASLNQ